MHPPRCDTARWWSSRPIGWRPSTGRRTMRSRRSAETRRCAPCRPCRPSQAATPTNSATRSMGSIPRSTAPQSVVVSRPSTRTTVIMTGAGGQTGPLLTIANGGNSAQAQKTFEGPVYMARTPNSSSTSFSANLTIKNGDLWYTGACPDDPTLAVDPHLSITPAGYGTQCVSHDWQTLFGSLSPPEFDVDTPTMEAPGAPEVDSYGCHVWEPGRYADAPPALRESHLQLLQVRQLLLQEHRELDHRQRVRPVRPSRCDRTEHPRLSEQRHVRHEPLQ